MSTDKKEHLECVIKCYRTSKEQTLLDKHRTKRDEVKMALCDKFGIDIYDPFLSGSFAKNTAINTKFDFDLVAPYKRNAFSTLEEMYNDVYDFLNEKYKSEAIIRKQKVSIGLDFNTDTNGDKVKIDVVPGRELNQNQYKDDNRVNLYVYNQFGKIEEGSERICSNVRIQIENIRDRATNEKDSIRKVIRLLKVWKVSRGYGPKSFFLELITIKAFDSKTITGDLWEKLKAVMEYIVDKVETVSLPDPGNSNNDVADTLSNGEKSSLKFDMQLMLTNIEQSSDQIKLYFPINPKHPCEDNKRGYSGDKSQVSVPPPTKFG